MNFDHFILNQHYQKVKGLGDRTMVKTLGRVRVKETFKCFGYDLYQLVTLERKRLAVAR
jgi:hypothetical protein